MHHGRLATWGSAADFTRRPGRGRVWPPGPATGSSQAALPRLKVNKSAAPRLSEAPKKEVAEARR